MARQMPYQYKYPQGPNVLQIETSIVCNAKCAFCPQKKVRRKPKYMDASLFRRIVDQTRGMGLLFRPFLFSEPLADPRIIEFLKYIKKDPSARIDLDTNGSLLSKELSKQLMDCQLEEIRFSVDGFYEETYSRRRGLNRNTVYKNVEQFAAAIRSSKVRTKTAVRMIRIPGCEKEEAEYKAFWQDRVDQVIFTKEYRYPWEGQEDPVLLPCLKIKDEMFIYVNGKVPLCCWDTEERSCVGDTSKQGILDIWNGKHLAIHRKLLDLGRRDRIMLCSRCDAYKGVNFSNFGFNKPANDEAIMPETAALGTLSCA